MISGFSFPFCSSGLGGLRPMLSVLQAHQDRHRSWPTGTGQPQTTLSVSSASRGCVSLLPSPHSTSTSLSLRMRRPSWYACGPTSTSRPSKPQLPHLHVQRWCRVRRRNQRRQRIRRCRQTSLGKGWGGLTLTLPLPPNQPPKISVSRMGVHQATTLSLTLTLPRSPPIPFPPRPPKPLLAGRLREVIRQWSCLGERAPVA